MDKFLLAENPMRPDSDDLYILHLPDPVTIIQVHDGNIPEKEGRIQEHFSFRNADGVMEFWTLSVFHLFTADFLETPAQRAIPLLKRAWRWYRAYLEWEDKQII